MKIATVASETVWKDSAANMKATRTHVAKVMASQPDTDIILFPEISLMGFVTDPSNADIAESIDGNSVTEVLQIAKDHNVAIICGIIEQGGASKPYNTTFVASRRGELLAVYRKNHLFTQSAEPDVFTAGTELITFDFEGWKCGISTCFDIRFPRLFEAYKSAGVECMFSGFNWVEGRNKPEIMKTLVKARAHENQYFFAAVDRTGKDPNTSYYGTSIISSPFSEDIGKGDNTYTFATIEKADIETLSKALPLAGSYRSEYQVVQG
jgi:omega-amidase